MARPTIRRFVQLDDVAARGDGVTAAQLETTAGAQAKADAAQSAAASDATSKADAAQAAAEAASIPLAQKGAASGVAELGADGLVPAAQIGGSLSGVYNVKTGYGAKGDGSTDDTAAIQAAIDAANAAYAATSAKQWLYLPSGRCVTDTALTWKSGVCLFGPGALVPVGGHHCIQAGGAIGSELTDIVFADFEIDGSQQTGNYKGIFLTYLQRARFLNLHVHDTMATGLGCDFLQDVKFIGCTVTGCGRYASGSETTAVGCSGIGIGTGAYDIEDWEVLACTLLNNVRYGVFSERQGGIATYFSRGGKIIGNHCEGNYWGIGSSGVRGQKTALNTCINNTQDGILVSKGNNGAFSCEDEIVDNTCEGNGRYGIGIDGTSDGNGTPPVHGGFTVKRNRVRGNTGVGIKLIISTQWVNSEIDGNKVYEGGSLGIDMSGSAGMANSSISYNKVTDNTGQGIRLLGNTSGCRVRGNTSTDTRSSASKTQTYGIDMSGAQTHTDLDLTDNRLDGNKTGAIHTGSTLAGTCIMQRNRGWNTGTGAPSFTAPLGTEYFRTDGTAGSLKYLNTDGATTWAAYA